MLTVLTIAATAAAAAAILGKATGRIQLHMIFKPAATILILLLAGTQGAPGSYRTFILIGLAFSLLGDIALMLPEERFLAGLAAFLFAHIFYIVGLGERNCWQFIWPAIFPFLLVGAIVWRLLWPHHLGNMTGPSFIYMFAILLMAWQAANLWLVEQNASSLAALLGAILFLASDSALAINRFRQSLPGADIIILSSYYGAQWLIALSTIAS